MNNSPLPSLDWLNVMSEHSKSLKSIARRDDNLTRHQIMNYTIATQPNSSKFSLHPTIYTISDGPIELAVTGFEDVAKQIAALPNLISALEAVVQNADKDGDTRLAIQKARAALAAAKGE